MIGIILNRPSFEQDIRELLMAFYPGETFVHREEAEVSFYIYGTEESGSYAIEIRQEGEPVVSERTLTDPDDRTETKNWIKRMLYRMLRDRTGKELPWGTLTGIRPAKIALNQLEQGRSEAEIFDFMRETYLTSRSKIELSIEIAKAERDLLAPIHYEQGYSLYVGIPFCPTTCLYCSFTSYPIGKWKGRTGTYLNALFQELEYTSRKMQGRPLDTVYLGGGTPTSLSAEDLDALLGYLDSHFDLAGTKEFTVEAGRPDSITREKLEVLKKYGVTRISINPQTMKQETLDLIGRHHSVDQVRTCFHMARELGFDNINMDLIIGLPEEELDDVRSTMEEIKKLGPDSITVHSLAIKRASRLNIDREKYGKLHITNTQEMIDLTGRIARSMGLMPYYLYRQKNMAGNFENVGYAAEGKAGIYNVLIMEEKQTIIACGAGTSTKVVYPDENRLERAENIKDVDLYIEKVREMIERKEKLLG